MRSPSFIVSSSTARYSLLLVVRAAALEGIRSIADVGVIALGGLPGGSRLAAAPLMPDTPGIRPGLSTRGMFGQDQIHPLPTGHRGKLQIPRQIGELLDLRIHHRWFDADVFRQSRRRQEVRGAPTSRGAGPQDFALTDE